MGRLAAPRLAILAALALASCKLTPAGTGGPGAAGTHGSGSAGTGGGGAGGSGKGGTGGTGGMAGTTPQIFLDGGAEKPTTTPDANCGAKSKTASKVAPDILILLDRSGSMNDDINDQMCRPDGGAGAGCGPESKWAKVTPAITQVVGETEADVNWGLKFFPDNSANACTVGSNVAVPIGPANGAAIAAAIMGATSTNGGVTGFNGTPTRMAAGGAATYMMSLTDMSPKYILLATDGLPTCFNNSLAMDDSAAAIAAVDAARTAGFPTFVVGIATSGTGTADATLSSLATAGGLPKAGGSPAYYPVSSASDLAAAIRTLVGVAATCTFQIGPPPTSDGTTDLKFIKVFGDSVEITRDKTHANGYDYTDDTMSSIQVYGPLCDQIMSGAIHDVTVAFTCLIL